MSISANTCSRSSICPLRFVEMLLECGFKFGMLSSLRHFWQTREDLLFRKIDLLQGVVKQVFQFLILAMCVSGGWGLGMNLSIDQQFLAGACFFQLTNSDGHELHSSMQGVRSSSPMVLTRTD
jgi:hypothetical protein